MFLLIVFAIISFSSAHQICYDPYGCYGDESPFDDTLVQLPENPSKINTKFYLYTLENKGVNDGQLLDPIKTNINDTRYKPNKRTVFVIHGFLGSSKEFWVRPMIDELLRKGDFNVIVMDAARGLQLPYHQAVGNARIIGAQLALLAKKLKISGADFKEMHCIGMGTGAHICGYMGRRIREVNGTIARITGLDPSGPYFENRSPVRRLDKTDAAFVDVIHTDSKLLFGIKGLGTPQEMGHVDFYPNGGYRQPGCFSLGDGPVQLVKCNHYRSVQYFIESINNKQCPSRAYACVSWEDFKKGLCKKCPKDGCPVMGYNAVEYKDLNKGKFYLMTEKKQPFCSYHYNIEFHTNSKMFGDLDGSVSVIITGEENVSETMTIPSHYYRAGSTDSFLIHTRHKLGKLLKIKVSHGAFLDQWNLNAVVVRPMWTTEAYTGCYQRWLNSASNEVYLKTGPPAHCSE